MAIIYLIGSNSTKLLQAPALIDDVTGQITGALVPTLPNHLVSKQYVDDSTIGKATTDQVSNLKLVYATTDQIDELEAEIDAKADQTDLTALAAEAMKLSGGTLTGPALYPGQIDGPVGPSELITLAYINSLGALIPENVLTQDYGDMTYLTQVGGTMTGPLTLTNEAAVDPLTAVTKRYTDEVLPPASTYVAKAGDTMAGPLKAYRFPVYPASIATRQYVDLWNNWLNTPMRAYIESGAIKAVLHPFFGTLDSDGKLLSIKNMVPGFPEFDMTASGESLVVSQGTFWKPTSTSQMGFASRASIMTNRVVIGVNDDPGVNSYGMGFAFMDDGIAYFEYRREHSGNQVNVGGRFRYHSSEGTDTEVTTSKRGKPTPYTPATYEFFRVPGGDGLTGRIWDMTIDNMGVNGNPGIEQPDGFIQYFGTRAVDKTPFPGTIGPIVVVDAEAPDMEAAKQAATDWIIVELAALMESQT